MKSDHDMFECLNLMDASLSPTMEFINGTLSIIIIADWCCGNLSSPKHYLRGSIRLTNKSKLFNGEILWM